MSVSMPKSISEAALLLKEKKLSAVELAEAALAATSARESDVDAYLEMLEPQPSGA